jgi:hypothetical protein
MKKHFAKEIIPMKRMDKMGIPNQHSEKQTVTILLREKRIDELFPIE